MKMDVITTCWCSEPVRGRGRGVVLEVAVSCGDLGEREGQVTCRSHAVVVGEPVVTGEGRFLP